LWAGSAYLEKSKSASTEGCFITGEPDISAVLSMSIEQTARLCREDLLKSARTILLQARQVNPLNTDHTANLGRLYKNWADLSTTSESAAARIDQSIAYFQEATTLSPQNTIIWNELATVYLYQLRDLEKTRETVLRSLVLDNRYEQTHMIHGDLLQTEAGLLRQQMATVQAELAAASEEQKAALETELARLETEWKAKLEAAVGAYEQAVEIEPRLINVFTTMALANEQMGRFEKAVEILNEAAAANPTSAEPYITLAEMYRRAGDPEAAIAAYLQGIALKPSNVNYRVALATLLESLGRLDEALLQVQEAARLTPEDPALRQSLAFMYQRLGMYPEALAEAQVAAQLAPNDATPRLLVGDLSRALNDLQTASAAYEQALAIAPSLENAWSVHLNLALIYGESGQFDLALAHAMAALETAPEDQWPQINDFIVQLEQQGSTSP
jgi:tetratricopeptide (TPR) repeat protein